MDIIYIYMVTFKEIGESKAYKFYEEHKKGIQIVEGLLVILLLVVLNFYNYESTQLNKRIQEDCGWADEKVECYCKKVDVDMIKSSEGFETDEINWSDLNVGLDR